MAIADQPGNYLHYQLAQPDYNTDSALLEVMSSGRCEQIAHDYEAAMAAHDKRHARRKLYTIGWGLALIGLSAISWFTALTFSTAMILLVLALAARWGLCAKQAYRRRQLTRQRLYLIEHGLLERPAQQVSAETAAHEENIRFHWRRAWARQQGCKDGTVESYCVANGYYSPFLDD